MLRRCVTERLSSSCPCVFVSCMSPLPSQSALHRGQRTAGGFPAGPFSVAPAGRLSPHSAPVHRRWRQTPHACFPRRCRWHAEGPQAARDSCSQVEASRSRSSGAADSLEPSRTEGNAGSLHHVKGRHKMRDTREQPDEERHVSGEVWQRPRRRSLCPGIGVRHPPSVGELAPQPLHVSPPSELSERHAVGVSRRLRHAA